MRTLLCPKAGQKKRGTYSGVANSALLAGAILPLDAVEALSARVRQPILDARKAGAETACGIALGQARAHGAHEEFSFGGGEFFMAAMCAGLRASLAAVPEIIPKIATRAGSPSTAILPAMLP